MLNVKVSDINIKNYRWSDNELFIPGVWNSSVNIQTITDKSLKTLFTDRYITRIRIPWLIEIVWEEDRSDYFNQVKASVEQRIFWESRFAIIQGPTGTWKTTLVKTIAYERGLEIYSDVWDPEKSISTFSEEVKSYNSWNVIQIKTIPWDLLKAMTSWAIYLVNEANFLNNDLLIWMANLIENGFFIFDWKKYLIHPNFSLVFTSNDWYVWTKDYSNAVVRKAWWIIEFLHEPDENSEVKIVKSIYKKQRDRLNMEHWNIWVIEEKDLEILAKTIRKMRKVLSENPFYTDDWADFRDYFYVRAYEKIIINFLMSEDTNAFISELIFEYNTKMSSHISYKDASWWYVEFENPVTEYNKIISHLWDQKISKQDAKWIKSLKYAFAMQGLGLDFDDIEESQENKWKTGKKNRKIDYSSFRQTIERETISEWLVLRREENIQKKAESFYSSIIKSKEEFDIEIKEFIDDKYLKISLNWDDILLSSDESYVVQILKKYGEAEQKEELSSYLNNNPDIDLYFIDEKYGDYIIQDLEYSKIKNIFSPEKSLYIRRRSKLIQLEMWGRQYVIMLWFKWSLNDIRYTDDEGRFYIPQSKVNDIIFSIYEKTNSKWKNIGSYFTIDEEGVLSIRKWSKKEEIPEGESVLEKISSDQELYKKIQIEIISRFRNADKLGLINWWKEYSRAWVISPVLPSADIQDTVYDILWRNLEFNTKTTRDLIEKITNSIKAWFDILLEWPSWVWKTSISKEIAKNLKLPYISLQIDEDFCENDIKWEIKWNEGMIESHLKPFLNFYKYWGLVELKELNYALISIFLNEYMDRDWTIHFNWEFIKRNPNFSIIATVNPAHQILFPDTKAINTSSKARFMDFFIDYLPEQEVIELSNLYLRNYNPDLELSFPDFENFISNLLWDIIYPIIEKVKNLMKTQDVWTDIELWILAKKIVTVDIIKLLITTSSSKEDFIKNVSVFFDFWDYKPTQDEDVDFIYEIQKKIKKL